MRDRRDYFWHRKTRTNRIARVSLTAVPTIGRESDRVDLLTLYHCQSPPTMSSEEQRDKKDIGTAVSIGEHNGDPVESDDDDTDSNASSEYEVVGDESGLIGRC